MLLVLVSWMRRASWPVRAGTLSLAFLSHAPAAVTTAALLLGWWMLSLARGELDRRQLAERLSAVAAAATIAWLAYYREIPLVFGGPLEAAREQGALVYVRGYRVGKVLQDLLLKFGLLPLALAWQGLGAVERPRARALLQAWLCAGVLLGLAAVLTPFPLRFEYFLCPAISLAAGLGAARLRAGGRGRWVTPCWSVALLVQAGIGALHLAGRFEIISVVLESPRWPFPVKL
jgi:hypothetical protein